MVDFLLKFPADRDLKILQLTDTQIIDSSQQRHPMRLDGTDSHMYKRWASDRLEENMFRYIRKVVDDSRPDLMIFTGDLVYGEFDDSGRSFLSFAEFFDSFKIPWAPIFGNHDNESARGVDWQSQVLEGAEYSLFKQKAYLSEKEDEGRRKPITGNGNYTVGLEQGGKLIRVFFMMDTNGCGGFGPESLVNGHTSSVGGLHADQIKWFEEKVAAIRKFAPEVHISLGLHLQPAIFAKALEKHGGLEALPLDLDKVERDGDFGFWGAGLKETVWDLDYKFWESLKKHGADSVFVGHEHANSASVLYEGVRLQYGQKSSTYDRANYVRPDGNLAVGSYSDQGKAIVGGSLIILEKNTGSIKKGCLQLYSMNNDGRSRVFPAGE